jgi:hypothetical protein
MTRLYALFAGLAGALMACGRANWDLNDCTATVQDDGHLDENNTAEDVNICRDMYSAECADEGEMIASILECPRVNAAKFQNTPEDSTDCDIQLMDYPPDQLPLFICAEKCFFRVKVTTPLYEGKPCEEDIQTQYGQIIGLETLCGRAISDVYRTEDSDTPEECNLYLDH